MQRVTTGKQMKKHSVLITEILSLEDITTVIIPVVTQQALHG